MDRFLPLLLWLLVILGVLFVKNSRNHKAAQSGTDKANLRSAAAPLLKELGADHLLYAHWEEREHFGRGVRTTFYRYGLTFQDQTLYVLPMKVNKRTREIQPGQVIPLTPSALGKIGVRTKEANGALRQLALHFYDKEGRTLLQLTVDAQTLRKNRWYPLNILQQEECEALHRFILPLAQRVEAENPGMDALLEAHAKEGFGVIGLIFAALGAFFVLFFPPAGIITALVGLALALWGKLRGAKSNKGLIISVLCFAWTLAFTWIYIKYLFI